MHSDPEYNRLRWQRRRGMLELDLLLLDFLEQHYLRLNETLQKDFDEWLNYYNNERTHQGKVCDGRTPLETLLSGKQVWSGKNLNQI